MHFHLTTHDLTTLYEAPNVRPLHAHRSGSPYEYAVSIPYGSAKAKRACLRGGLEIGEYEGVLEKPLSLRFETTYPHLEITRTTAGHGSWSAAGGADCEMAPGISTLVYMAEHRVDAQLHPAARVDHTEVRIDMRCFGSLNEELRHITAGGFYSHQLADDPQITRLFEELKNCPYTGSLRQLYLEGKCYELLTRHLSQAGRIDSPGRARTRWSADDIRCLHQARGLLSQNWRNPPNLLQLARMAGINDYKLKLGFKELFGTTVFGYIRNIRMNEARCLLERGEANVSQAAVFVGYQNLSHFASAYRRTFGYNPSECVRSVQEAAAGAEPANHPSTVQEAPFKSGGPSIDPVQ